MTAVTAPVGAVAEERRVAAALVGELAPRFAGRVSCDEVAVCVDQAVTDLRGSVCAEALPEMAARLAHHRLTVATEPDWRDPAEDSPGRPGAVEERVPVTGAQIMTSTAPSGFAPVLRPGPGRDIDDGR